MRKKISFILCVFLLSHGSSISQNLQRVTDSGNVTTNSIVIKNAQGLGIGVDAASGYTVNSHFLKPSSLDYRTLRFDCTTVDGNGGWEFYNSNLSQSLMYIRQSGNIGIGTSSPQAKLDVNGWARFGAAGLGFTMHGNGSATATGWNGYYKSDETRLGYIGSSATDMYYVAERGARHVFDGGNVWIATPNAVLTVNGDITTNGGVGIGTSSPQAKLDVNGWARFGAAGLGFTMHGDGSATATGWTGYYKPNKTRLGYVGSSATDMYYVAENGARHVFDGGGVWIVAANSELAVNGGVTAKRVKVTQTMPWPDYVFEAGYHLPAITELEKYVSLHNHLPGIPSAKEVESDGLDLGGMQQKQMQKIEELTLYLIEQHKKLETQQQLILDQQQLLLEQDKRLKALEGKQLSLVK